MGALKSWKRNRCPGWETAARNGCPTGLLVIIIGMDVGQLCGQDFWGSSNQCRIKNHPHVAAEVEGRNAASDKRFGFDLTDAMWSYAAPSLVMYSEAHGY